MNELGLGQAQPDWIRAVSSNPVRLRLRLAMPEIDTPNPVRYRCDCFQRLTYSQTFLFSGDQT